jgi:membrane-bound ClpP family serine protease
MQAPSDAAYVYVFLFVLMFGLLLLYIGINRIGNDPWNLRQPFRSWDLPFIELLGALIAGLGVGGLLGVTFFSSAWIGVGLGLVIGAVAVGWTFSRRSDAWEVRSIEDTVLRPPGLGEFVGESARALEAIAAGSSGDVSVTGPGGELMAVIAVADVDVPKGSVLTVTGVRGLNLVVAPITSHDKTPTESPNKP